MRVTTFEIGQKKFVPVRVAAGIFGYSPDHVTRLAKAKKIVALQSGRLWFVEIDSLQSYKQERQLEDVIRQKQLRIKRQQELRIKTALSQPVMSTGRGVRVNQKVAVLVLAAVLFVGVFTNSNVLEMLSAQSAAVSVAAGDIIDTADTSAITPTFTTIDGEVHIDQFRSVPQPVVTEHWRQTSL